MGNFWSDLLRNILGFFDVIIYGFIDNVYNTFTNIASYTLINNTIIDTFTQRVYIIVGIFMLFKMSFSLINYFVDPDKITDSKSGFGNLVQRIIISLVTLVLVPTIFNIAFYAQTIVLNENILANIILGGTYDDIDAGSFVDTYENAGKKMAFSVLSAFMAPKDTSVITMTEKEIEKEFEGEDKEIESYKKYLEARDNNNISGLVGMNGIKNNEDDSGYYIYNYMPGLSTLAGVAVLMILLSFCVDIGVRAAKLVFLQLVAPIPVLSYIDLTKGKDVFNKWVKNCVSTYLDVFVRLLAIYFVIFIITLITQNGFTLYTYTLKGGQIVTTEVENVDLFAQALIIIGLLLFAKELPSLLEDILGIKFSGKFSFNPMKRLGEAPLVGGFVTGALAAGGFAAWNTTKNVASRGKDQLSYRAKNAWGHIRNDQDLLDRSQKQFDERKKMNNRMLKMGFYSAAVGGLNRVTTAGLGGMKEGYKGDRMRDMTLQGATGDSSRKAGAKGFLESVSRQAQRKMAYETPKQDDTPGLKAAKLANFRLQNHLTNMKNEIQGLRSDLSSTDQNLRSVAQKQLKISDDWDNKGKTKEILESYNGLISSGVLDGSIIDTEKMNNFDTTFFDNLSQISEFNSLNAGEREQIYNFLQGKVDDQIAQEKKLMESKK